MKSLVILLLLAIASVATAETQFPQGWRTATAEEIHIEPDWRVEDPQRYLTVEADFNGDGQIDTAKLLVNEKTSAMGLFVQIGSEAGIIQLDEMDDKSMIQVMGISMAAPGFHKTACGKGYFECGPCDPEMLDLKNPGIDYFKTESANSFFYWDATTSSFKRIWMSD